MVSWGRAAHAALAVVFVLTANRVALAQDTREAELAAEQARKATDLHPYEPTPLERRIQRIENALLNPPPGYVFIGSVMRGGLLAVGPGYRGTFGDSGRFDVHGAWSLKSYKVVDGTVRLPEMVDGRIRVDLRGSWLDAPRVAFYGLGDGSSPRNRTTFLYRAATAGTTARLQATSVLAMGVGIDSVAFDSGHGAGGTSVEEMFTPRDVPGLGASANYAKTQLFAEVDSRQSPGYTRRGGLYRIEWNNFHETTAGTYSFRRVNAEVNQFIPLLRENWVIALRALVSVTDTDAGQAVPYFLMPDLGGGRELRGYPSWRFRDRQRMLLTAEYRWTAGQFVDMALFFDAGKVVARRADLNLDTLRTTYGIGVRFHAPAATVMRIELAHAHEGNGLVFAFGPSF